MRKNKNNLWKSHCSFKHDGINQRWEVEPRSVLLPGVTPTRKSAFAGEVGKQGLGKSWALFQKEVENHAENTPGCDFLCKPCWEKLQHGAHCTHWDINIGKYLLWLWEDVRDPEWLDLSSVGWAGRRFPVSSREFSRQLLLQRHLFPFFLCGSSFFSICEVIREFMWLLKKLKLDWREGRAGNFEKKLISCRNMFCASVK